jgi:hypothetical protein
LPEHLKDQTQAAMRLAFRLTAREGMARLEKQAEWLGREYPSAAASLREGLAGMFTVSRLGLSPHPARAIWALVGRLDLSRFYDGIESSAEEGGRPAFDPQLLISLWVYAYSQGMGSAREVARRCEFDPAFQWLTGLDEVNYHTLASFRVERQKELDELFTQLLAALIARKGW